MRLNINNVDSEREKNKKFAEENGITQEEMDEVYKEIYSQLPDNLTGDKREARALRKARGTLKGRLNAGKRVDAFILMRFRDNDFEANAWNKVNDYVKEHGQDVAEEKGMIDHDGNYLHTSFTTSFSNQHGKVIDKENIRGSAIAIATNDDGKNELRWLNIGKFTVNENIPLCREVKIIIKEGNQAGPLFPNVNAFFLNGVQINSENAYYSDEDFQAYGDLIEELCGDIAYYTKSEIDQYAQANANNTRNYIAVPVESVLRLGKPFDDGTVPIDLEIDDGQITAWASKNIFKGLTIEEGIQGIAMLNVYLNKEGVTGCRIGGFIPLL